MQARVLTTHGALYVLPVPRERGFRMCSCWQRGRIKSPQVGPVTCYLIVFTEDSLCFFKKEIWWYRCPYALIFVFMGQPLILMRWKWLKNVIEEGRGIGANFLLHFRALILMLLTQLECENIFGSQYALLQNKGINKLVSSLQKAVFGWKKE